MNRPMELICPAGTPASLRVAVDSGADAVYLGFRDATNARNFPGLNFSRDELAEGIGYAHAAGAKVFVAINTFPRAGCSAPWTQAANDAARLGADAVIVADLGLADYVHRTHPELRLHLSVQAAASSAESIRFYVREFGIKRVVLPRVLSVDEIKAVHDHVPVELEVFAFGGLCVMAEGRCLLSSYLTGQSPNTSGVCSPAECVRYEERGPKLVSSLNGYTINTFRPDESAGYPTLCKGRFVANDEASYLFEEPTSLNVIDMLPQLQDAGVVALKIEGRQRGQAYVAGVVSAFRAATDALAKGEAPPPVDLALFTEGGSQTEGAYAKGWQ